MLTSSDFKKLESIFVTKVEFNELKGMVQELVFEVRGMKEELQVTNYRQVRHTDILDTHEDRLRALEKKMGFI